MNRNKKFRGLIDLRQVAFPLPQCFIEHETEFKTVRLSGGPLDGELAIALKKQRMYDVDGDWSYEAKGDSGVWVWTYDAYS